MKNIKSSFPKWEQWQVTAKHTGAENQHSHTDYEYEKVGDGPVNTKRLSAETANLDNVHSHNSKLRWFEVEGPAADEAASDAAAEPAKPAMKVKEIQPKQPKAAEEAAREAEQTA